MLIDFSLETTNEYVMTATEWEYSSMEPKGWYLTEKYDGMRLYWNGSNFFTRQGRHIKVSKLITKQMPSVALDGELWTQYGLHQEAVNLGKTTNEDKWKKAIYWIFDAPQQKTMRLEERIKFLQNLKLPSFAKVVSFVKCEGKEHLKEFNESVTAKGGEGVVLREPGSFYELGRSTSMRKYRSFLDAEVKIVENRYPYGFQCEQ